jgi:hypothetical protein
MAEMAVFIMVSFCNDAIAETENCAAAAIGTPGTGSRSAAENRMVAEPRPCSRLRKVERSCGRQI